MIFRKKQESGSGWESVALRSPLVSWCWPGVGLFATAEQAVPAPPAPTAALGPSVFRCAECGHGQNLRAWATVNIHGDLAPDGNIEWPDYEDDAFWPVIEESVTCKVHGEDHIEKLIDGRHVPLANLAMEGGRYVAPAAASTGGRR